MEATTRNGRYVELFIYYGEYEFVFKTDVPPEPTRETTPEELRETEKWKKADRLAMLHIQRLMTETVRGGILECATAKTYLAAIDEKFKESNKAQTGNLLTNLTNMKYDGNGNVREHFLKMVYLENKLGELEMPLNDQILVHMALNSLPSKYESLD